MSDPVFMVGQEAAFLGLDQNEIQAELLSSDDDIRAAYLGHHRAVWILKNATLLSPLTSLQNVRQRARRLLALTSLENGRRQLYETFFKRVITPDQGVQLLPFDELMDVLRSNRRQDYLIGGVLAPNDQVLILYRGNLEPIIVPWSWFRSQPDGTQPNFDDFEVIDSGQTIRLGMYEASTDAVLYEYDAEYRKRAKQRQVEEDDSFGGSLRRLRLLKGLKRNDFPGITAKEIARIERGEVNKPHPKTLDLLASTLGVAVEELETY